MKATSKERYAEKRRRRAVAAKSPRENPLQRRLCTVSEGRCVQRPLSHLVQSSRRKTIGPLVNFQIGALVHNVFARWIAKGGRRT